MGQGARALSAPRPNDDGAAGGAQPPADAEPGAARIDPPLWRAAIWPHRSMSRRGFGVFLAVLAAGLAFPVTILAGAGVGLMIIAPAALALGLVYAMVELNYRAGRVREEVRVWPDLMEVERREPNGRVRRWRANPYWVRVDLSDTRRVRRYLTLAGGGRVIELGAFLTPDERVALADEIRAALGRAVAAAAR